MVKRNDRPSPRGRAEEGVRTRARMVDAALQTLIAEGYAGTSARLIATRGQFNPALVFYHYSGVDELLLAALDKSSGERLERYREAMAEPGSPRELVRRAAELFREDVEGGHVIAVTELIGASLSKPQLRSEVIARMTPWLELTQRVLESLIDGSPLTDLEPAAHSAAQSAASAAQSAAQAAARSAAEPAAFAIVSGYLGLNMLSRLMPDLSQTAALFGLLEQVAQLVSPPAAGSDD